MKGVKLGETILLLPTKGYTAHSTALEALSYGEVWAGRNVPGLSRPCRHLSSHSICYYNYTSTIIVYRKVALRDVSLPLSPNI